MAYIECFINSQRLGFIQIRDNEPYYGYSKWECTHIPIDNAIKLVSKLSDKYLFKIHRDKTDPKKEHAHYIVVD